MQEFGIYIDGEGAEHKALIIAVDENNEAKLLFFKGNENDFDNGGFESKIVRLIGVKHVEQKAEHPFHAFYVSAEVQHIMDAIGLPTAADLDKVAEEEQAKGDTQQ